MGEQDRKLFNYSKLKPTGADDRSHSNPETFERTECGCNWWECDHCQHGVFKVACIKCDDPFKDVGR